MKSHKINIETHVDSKKFEKELARVTAAIEKLSNTKINVQIEVVQVKPKWWKFW